MSSSPSHILLNSIFECCSITVFLLLVKGLLGKPSSVVYHPAIIPATLFSSFALLCMLTIADHHSTLTIFYFLFGIKYLRLRQLFFSRLSFQIYRALRRFSFWQSLSVILSLMNNLYSSGFVCSLTNLIKFRDKSHQEITRISSLCEASDDFLSETIGLVTS